MRRLMQLVPVLAVALCSAYAQTWEKIIAPGLSYRMEVDVMTPRTIHALRWTPGTPETSARPELAGRVVYGAGGDKGRGTVSQMVAENSAIAGINGDFFPFTGDPLGLMVAASELKSRPFPKRGFLSWGPKGSFVGRADFAGKLFVRGLELGVEGFNEDCPQNGITVNSPVAGRAIANPAGTALRVQIEAGRFELNKSTSGLIVEVITGVSSVPIQVGEFVIMFSGRAQAEAAQMAVGQRVTFLSYVNGLDESRAENAVGGGPILLKDGQVSVSWQYEGFTSDFALKRHPRTVVGITATGDIWFVAIDGRQSMSAGATLEEAARIMLRLGCVDAVNLDGGGSTAMNVFGIPVNRPSDGQERPVANGILFFGPPTNGNGEKLRINAPERLPAGGLKTISVVTDAGVEVANSEVFWHSQGSGWIDQGGQVKPIGEGQIVVRAFVRGQVLETSIAVDAKPPKVRTASSSVRTNGGQAPKQIKTTLRTSKPSR